MNGKIYKQNIVFPIPNMIYVAENGNDTTGDGSLSRPYASLNAAMAAIGSDPTTISLAAGTYTGAPVAWKGNVSLIGSGASTTSIQNDLSYTAPAAGEETFTFWGVSVANPFDFDFALANQAVVFLNEGGYSPNRIDTSPPGPRFLFINNSTVGEFNCAGTIIFNSCIFLGGPNEIQDGGTVLMNGCTVGVPIDLFATGALQVVSCIFPGSVVGHIVGPDTPTLYTDSPSRAQMASVTDTNITLTDDAKYNAYIPTTPSDWLTPPTIVQEGLDELASRIPASGHDDTQVGTRGAPVAITAVGGIPFTSTTLFTSIYVEGDTTPVVISANPQIAAGNFIGQKLRIFFCDDVNTVTIANGTGTDMNGNITGGTNDAIEYEWDGANWYETWRRG